MAAPSRRTFLGLTVAAALAPRALSAAGAAATSPATRPAHRRRTSFSFLHTYEATGRYWHALEKAGLIRATTGVRLVHSSPWGGESRGFNEVARVGGELHRFIAEHRCPFIVDRVAGGLPYAPYAFDRRLLQAYAGLLGEKFLGGQVHEVISNTHNDWNRLAQAAGADAGKPISADRVRPFFAHGDGVADQLEYGTVDDYAGQTAPRTATEWWAECRRGARRQIARVDGRFSYCEGSDYAWSAWGAMFALGARYGLAEQGVWASPQGQLSIASLRGAARAYGRPWGVFFAPWGPDGNTAFTPPQDWAWQCPLAFLKKAGWPVGPTYGASTALQRRLFFHAYVSGAWTLHEEWGSDTTFTDWSGAKLSSSGQVVRELLDFQAAHPDVGEPYTPLALLLDAPEASADPTAWNPVRAALFRGGQVDTALSKLEDAGAAEAGCYCPCSVPEVFDVVPSDAPPDALRAYEKVIPVRAGASDLAADVVRAARALSPIDRTSAMVMQINHRASDGAWIVALHNPWGGRRGDVYNIGSILNDRCAQTDTLRPRFSFKRARAIYAWPMASALDAETSDRDKLNVRVGPGGTLVLELLV
jgi:hypothetical protein